MFSNNLTTLNIDTNHKMLKGNSDFVFGINKDLVYFGSLMSNES